MRNPQGYGFEIDRVTGKVIGEWDTFTCAHCQHVVRFRKMAEAHELGGHCTLCDKMICSHCVGKPCEPFEEKIRAAETRHANRREG